MQIHIIRRILVCIALLGILLAVSACEGEDGEPGDVNARFARSPDVTAADVSNLIPGAAGVFPNELTQYNVASFGGLVTWISGGTNYAALISIPRPEGEKGEDGLLPPIPVIDLSPVTAVDGEDAGNRSVLLFFNTNQVQVISLTSRQIGTQIAP